MKKTDMIIGMWACNINMNIYAAIAPEKSNAIAFWIVCMLLFFFASLFCKEPKQ